MRGNSVVCRFLCLLLVAAFSAFTAPLRSKIEPLRAPPLYQKMVFPQQIAALEIIAAFDAILLAQTQSGKTGTFMLVLSEMIRLGKVEYSAATAKSTSRNTPRIKTNFSTLTQITSSTSASWTSPSSRCASKLFGDPTSKTSQKGNTIYLTTDNLKKQHFLCYFFYSLATPFIRLYIYLYKIESYFITDSSF